VLAFIVLRFRARLRFFTLTQQALAVFALLLNDRIVVLMVRGFSGEGLPPWTFWLSPVRGAVALALAVPVAGRPAPEAARQGRALMRGDAPAR
jgi:cell shape-determining protein MreD